MTILNLYFTFNGLSFTCSIHPKTPIVSKISDNILSQKDAQASFLSLFLNSVKFSLRPYGNWLRWLLKKYSNIKILKNEIRKR